MKKIGIASTLMVSGALILAACNTPTASSPNTGSAPQSGLTPQGTVDLTLQPGGNQTSTPASPGLFSTATQAPGSGETGSGFGTSDATATVDTTATTGTDQTATQTPVTGADQAATQAPTTGTDQTATPATGTTGQNSTQAGVENGLVRLSSILQANVTSSDSQQAGQVRGVLLTGPAINGNAGQDPSVNLDGPAVSYLAVNVVNTAGGAQATVAPTSESAQGDANRAYGESWNRLAGQNDLVLVPWQAFNFDQAASANASSGINSRLNLAAMTGAPHFSAATPPDFAGANWNTTVDQYWASQGTGIAVTGTTGSEIGQPVLLTAPFNGINVALQNGQTVAQVQDFLVNPASGRIEYVLLSGGSLGQRYLPVPAGAMSWNQVTTLGAESGLNVPQNFSLGISDQMFNKAPTVDDVNNILGANSNTWRQNVDQYWQDFLHTGSEQVK